MEALELSFPDGNEAEKYMNIYSCGFGSHLHELVEPDIIQTLQKGTTTHSSYCSKLELQTHWAGSINHVVHGWIEGLQGCRVNVSRRGRCHSDSSSVLQNCDLSTEHFVIMYYDKA